MYAIDGGAESEGNFSVFAVDVDSAEPPRASAQVIAVGSFRRHGNASVVCCLRFRIVFLFLFTFPVKCPCFHWNCWQFYESGFGPWFRVPTHPKSNKFPTKLLPGLFCFPDDSC